MASDGCNPPDDGRPRAAAKADLGPRATAVRRPKNGTKRLGEANEGGWAGEQNLMPLPRESCAQARGGSTQTARTEARGRTSETRRRKATGWATRKKRGSTFNTRQQVGMEPPKRRVRHPHMALSLCMASHDQTSHSRMQGLLRRVLLPRLSKPACHVQHRDKCSVLSRSLPGCFGRPACRAAHRPGWHVHTLRLRAVDGYKVYNAFGKTCHNEPSLAKTALEGNNDALARRQASAEQTTTSSTKILSMQNRFNDYLWARAKMCDGSAGFALNRSLALGGGGSTCVRGPLTLEAADEGCN